MKRSSTKKRRSQKRSTTKKRSTRRKLKPESKMYTYDDLHKTSIDELKRVMHENGINLQGTKTKGDLIRRIMNTKNEMRRYIDSFHDLLYNHTVDELKEIMRDNTIKPLSGNKRDLIKRILDNGIQWVK